MKKLLLAMLCMGAVGQEMAASSSIFDKSANIVDCALKGVGAGVIPFVISNFLATSLFMDQKINLRTVMLLEKISMVGSLGLGVAHAIKNKPLGFASGGIVVANLGYIIYKKYTQTMPIADDTEENAGGVVVDANALTDHFKLYALKFKSIDKKEYEQHHCMICLSSINDLLENNATIYKVGCACSAIICENCCNQPIVNKETGDISLSGLKCCFIGDPCPCCRETIVGLYKFDPETGLADVYQVAIPVMKNASPTQAEEAYQATEIM